MALKLKARRNWRPDKSHFPPSLKEAFRLLTTSLLLLALGFFIFGFFMLVESESTYHNPKLGLLTFLMSGGLGIIFVVFRNLDQRTALISNSRWSTYLMVGTSIFFLVTGFLSYGFFIWLGKDQELLRRDSRIGLALALIGSSVGMLFVIWRVVDQRPILTFSQDGITYRSLRSHLIPWEDIISVRPMLNSEEKSKLNLFYKEEYVCMKIKNWNKHNSKISLFVGGRQSRVRTNEVPIALNATDLDASDFISLVNQYKA
jgi:hypothetical protein